LLRILSSFPVWPSVYLLSIFGVGWGLQAIKFL
jgi:hypothetical protein